MCEPVGRIIFAKALARLGGDDALIKRFQYVLLYRRPLDTCQPSRQRAHEFWSTLDFKGPVEEILFDNAVDAAAGECGAGKHVLGCDGCDVETENGMCDDFGGVDEQAMLDEQLIGVLELVAERRRQEF